MFKVLVCSHKRELAPWGGLTALTAEPASLPTGSVASRQLLPACNPLFALAPGAKAPFCGAPSVSPVALGQPLLWASLLHPRSSSENDFFLLFCAS